MHAFLRRRGALGAVRSSLVLGRYPRRTRGQVLGAQFATESGQETPVQEVAGKNVSVHAPVVIRISLDS